MTDDLFASIDALLTRPRPVDDLPAPAERERLRKVGEYTQEELAAALKTRRETIVRWEAGTTEPRPPKREVYIRFLATLALQHGTVEPTEWLRRAQAAGLAGPTGEPPTAPTPAPTAPAPAADIPASPAPAPAEPAAALVPAPAAPAASGAAQQDQPLVEPDRTAAGEPITADSHTQTQAQPALPEPAAATVEQPAPTPVVPQLMMLDQHPDGSLVMGPALACVQCGNLSPYRVQGLPMHLGGFCRPGSAPAAAPAATPSAEQQSVPAAVARAETVPVAVPRTAPAPAAAPRRMLSRSAPSRPRRAAAKKVPEQAGPADWEAAAAARFPAGPLAVLDVAEDGRQLVAYLADGTVAPTAPTAPTGRTLAAVVEWALEAKLGSPRLHRHGRDSDALVVLTDAVLAELGLPPMGKDEKTQFVPRLGQLAKTHKAVKALTKAGWQLTQRGLGPWARVYQEPEGGKRVCVQLCIPGWGALASGGWQIPDGLAAPELARLLGTYATRVLTPRGSTAVSGLELVTALRPPTRAQRTENGWTSGPVEGSRPKDAFDPAPPEVPDMHPLAQDRQAGGALATEAWDWCRPLTETELAAPFAVGLDINMAFLAAAGRLTLPLSPPVHELQPAFDKRIPGSWLVDLSHVATDPLLPNPFTADGAAPNGPAWYSTVKVAYAIELGAQVQPIEAWLRHEHGPYLDPWHKRLRQAYLDTMAALGVPTDLADGDPLAFLDAMAGLKTGGDAAELAVLHAIKQTAKGTIGKLRERPRGHGYKIGQRWPALDRPTWDPLMRALVIDTATVNFHRKLRKMAAETGLHCFAVLSDCAVFAAPGPGALDILTRPDGTLTTALRLGVSPGLVKFEGSRPMPQVRELLADGANPARHIKTGGAVSDDE
ncbi:telomere-associated protein Tap [Streptomyces tateyamensis]|uniref:telomere-associated protein Tap n=1 Tax=Streptomyces tateyamensis TaxID=565073 RepID=UPI0011B71DF8|nr:helix-turn-helix transcriptional regulator [Streptomyces tateyamensis]